MTYAETFVALTHEWDALNRVDDLVEQARMVFPGSQYLQLEMDRQKAEADQQRARIVEFVAISAILN